ncbi:MAG: fructose-6-phosphate aldolase [Holosporaceae bacterium]|jgi:transaldolase|nr:fructose-6-phosphate aldolase [Holosporaceae bacterium]
MEIFLDTVNLDEIALYEDFIDGVTTNPSLLAGINSNAVRELLQKICKSVSGPVSIEVISEKYEDMLVEGREIAKINNNVCVKLPCTFDGLRVCRKLSSEGISTNLTLCFSPTQALLAAACGATYISPFAGRLDDVGQDGMSLVEETVDIFDVQGCETRVLVASVRNVQHVIQAALCGADAITVPPAVLKQCFIHPLTDKGLEIFKKDWKKKMQQTRA